MADLPQPFDRRRQRVRRVSRFLKVLSGLSMVITVIAVIMAWVLPIVVIGPTYGTPAKPTVAQAANAIDHQQNRLYLELAGTAPTIRVFTGSVIAQSVSRLQPNRDLLARAVTAVYLAFWALGFWMFYRLFQTYEHGDILTAESAHRLKRVGFWMIGIWGCGMWFQISKIWWELQPSFRVELGAELILGVFICLLAWIMEEAHLIAEEQALTV
jgi:hypothetical protein